MLPKLGIIDSFQRYWLEKKLPIVIVNAYKILKGADSP